MSTPQRNSPTPRHRTPWATGLATLATLVAIAVAIVFLTTTSANPTPQTTAVDSRGDRVGWVVVGRNPCTGKHTPFCRAARNYDLAHRSHGAVP